MGLANGATAVRSHVGIYEGVGTKAVEALLEVREALRGRVDLQLVALTVSLTDPEGERLLAPLRAAMEMGVDVVGGCPHLDPNPAAYRRRPAPSPCPGRPNRGPGRVHQRGRPSGCGKSMLPRIAGLTEANQGEVQASTDKIVYVLQDPTTWWAPATPSTPRRSASPVPWSPRGRTAASRSRSGPVARRSASSPCRRSCTSTSRSSWLRGHRRGGPVLGQAAHDRGHGPDGHHPLAIIWSPRNTRSSTPSATSARPTPRSSTPRACPIWSISSGRASCAAGSSTAATTARPPSSSGRAGRPPSRGSPPASRTCTRRSSSGASRWGSSSSTTPATRCTSRPCRSARATRLSWHRAWRSSSPHPALVPGRLRQEARQCHQAHSRGG
jgi:hypothetical protein